MKPESCSKQLEFFRILLADRHRRKHRQSQTVTDSHRKSQTVTESHRKSHTKNRPSRRARRATAPGSRPRHPAALQGHRALAPGSLRSKSRFRVDIFVGHHGGGHAAVCARRRPRRVARRRRSGHPAPPLGLAEPARFPAAARHASAAPCRRGIRCVCGCRLAVGVPQLARRHGLVFVSDCSCRNASRRSSQDECETARLLSGSPCHASTPDARKSWMNVLEGWFARHSSVLQVLNHIEKRSMTCPKAFNKLSSLSGTKVYFCLFPKTLAALCLSLHWLDLAAAGSCL